MHLIFPSFIFTGEGFNQGWSVVDDRKRGRKILVLRNCRRLIGYWAPANRRANTGEESDTILVGRLRTTNDPAEVSGLAFRKTRTRSFISLFGAEKKSVLFGTPQVRSEVGASPRCGSARFREHGHSETHHFPSRRAGRGFGKFGQSRDEM